MKDELRVPPSVVPPTASASTPPPPVTGTGKPAGKKAEADSTSLATVDVAPGRPLPYKDLGIGLEENWALMPTRPSLRLSVGGSAHSSIPFADIAGTVSGAQDGTLPEGNGALSGDAAARVNLEYRSRYFDFGVSANVAGSAQTPGNAALMDTARGGLAIKPGMESLIDEAQALQTSFESHAGDIATLTSAAGILSSSSSSKADKLAALGQVTKALNNLKPLLASLNSTVGNLQTQMADLETFVGGLSNGTQAITASAGARGSIDIGATGRIPLPSPIPSVISDLHVAVRGDVHVIPNTPDSLKDRLPQDGPVTLERLAIASDGNVRVSLQGVEELQKAVKEAAGLLKAYDKAKPYLDNPVSAVGDPAGAKTALEGLQTSATSTASAVDSLSETLSAGIGVEVSTYQPTTSVGAGMGLGVGFTVGARPSWGGVQIGLQAKNLVGLMPARRDDYAGSLDLLTGTSSFEKVGSQDVNAFHVFYPATLAADARTYLPWTGTQLNVGAEHQLGAGTGTAVRAGVWQSLPGPLRPVSVMGGYEHRFMPAGVPDRNLYMGGLGLDVGPVALTAQAGADSLDTSKVTQARANFAVQGNF